MSTGNTVGSLTQLQESVVIGSLLGDGYLRTIKGRKDAFLEVNHSYNQKEYVDWKYEILRSVTISGPRKRRGKEGRVAYRFFTRQLPELSGLEEAFYVCRRKIVPESIRLDPVALAVWFMDDGSKCDARGIYLNTQQFALESQKRLLRVLDYFSLKARLNRDKSYYRIRFLNSSLPRLKALISNYIIPSMKYKIEL